MQLSADLGLPQFFFLSIFFRQLPNELTELRNSTKTRHVRKSVLFENACSKSEVFPPLDNWGPKTTIFDDFAT